MVQKTFVRGLSAAMRAGLRVTLMAFFLLASSSIAGAGTITFDEFPATDNNVALTYAYSGEGVVFDSRNSGTLEGIAQGDPGNWTLNGTNGPQFLGNNGVNDGHSYVESIFFTNPQTNVLFDASRGNSIVTKAGQTMTADAYDASDDLLSSETQILGPTNTWSTFALTGADISRLDISSSNSADRNCDYVLDNLRFTAPEPATLTLLGSALLGLGVVYLRRRRAARRTAKSAPCDQPRDDAAPILAFPSHSCPARAARRAA